VVTPECGILLPAADPATEAERYSQHLARLIASPDARRAMGTRARARIVAHFELAQMGERLAAMLDYARQLGQQTPRTPYPPRAAHECAVQAIELLRVVSDRDQVFAECRELGAARTELLQHVREVEAARDWFRDQLERSQNELLQHVREVEAARDWFRDQLERSQNELLQRVHEVEAARDWFRDQLERSQKVADDESHLVAELREWARQIEDARNWHDTERQKALAALQAQAEQFEESLSKWQRQFPLQVLRRLRLLRTLTIDGSTITGKNRRP